MRNSYFLEQLKSPLFNFFKKLPIIQTIILNHEYLAHAGILVRGISVSQL